MVAKRQSQERRELKRALRANGLEDLFNSEDIDRLPMERIVALLIGGVRTRVLQGMMGRPMAWVAGNTAIPTGKVKSDLRKNAGTAVTTAVVGAVAAAAATGHASATTQAATAAFNIIANVAGNIAGTWGRRVSLSDDQVILLAYLKNLGRTSVKVLAADMQRYEHPKWDENLVLKTMKGLVETINKDGEPEPCVKHFSDADEWISLA